MRRYAGLARDLSRVSGRLIAYNLAYLALAFAVAVGSVAVFWLHPAWYTFALAFVVVSSRHHALLNCEHECIHRKFVRGRRGNDFIGRWLCGAPVGSPYGASKARHLSHHRLLATPEDPDRDLHSGPGKESRAGLVKHFFGGLLGGYAGMVLMGPKVKGRSPSDDSAGQDLVALAVVQALMLVAFTLIFAWWVYLALWVLPLVTMTVLLHLVRTFVEHAITKSEAERHSDRLITIPSNLVERGLVAPYGMNYHGEHHLAPSVPAPRLPELQRRLAESEEAPALLVRPSYGRALLGYARSLRG